MQRGLIRARSVLDACRADRKAEGSRQAGKRATHRWVLPKVRVQKLQLKKKKVKKKEEEETTEVKAASRRPMTFGAILPQRPLDHRGGPVLRFRARLLATRAEVESSLRASSASRLSGANSTVCSAKLAGALAGGPSARTWAIRRQLSARRLANAHRQFSQVGSHLFNRISLFHRCCQGGFDSRHAFVRLFSRQLGAARQLGPAGVGRSPGPLDAHVEQLGPVLPAGARPSRCRAPRPRS